MTDVDSSTNDVLVMARLIPPAAKTFADDESLVTLKFEMSNQLINYFRII